MECKIIWTESALGDLRSAVWYIATDNPEAALRIGRGILECVTQLGRFPFLGGRYPAFADAEIRVTTYQRYRIFYEVDESARLVHILHVWHGSRDESQLGQ